MAATRLRVVSWNIRAGIGPAYRRVDTCAGEFPAETPYFYSSYADSEVAPPADRRSVILDVTLPPRPP